MSIVPDVCSGENEMELRKLESGEHLRTRALWERIFLEDTKAFLDYYYFLKTKENEIYVVEEEGEIYAMLHLNPYLLQIEEHTARCHYIVAVATEKTHRRRGYMGKLLCRSMQEMYVGKEPFTFLMPASEGIYTPYDFRFVYRQEQREVSRGEESKELMQDRCKTGGIREMIRAFPCFWDEETHSMTEFSDATLGDAGEMAAFVQQHFAGQWQVCAVRDEVYYQTLLFEQQSENGGICLMRDQGELVGLFLYAEEDEPEIREPLFRKGREAAFHAMLEHLLDGGKERVSVYAWEAEEIPSGQRDSCSFQKKSEPLIMVRILHLESLFSCMEVRAGEKLDCSFAVVDSFLPQNSRIWHLSGDGDTGENVQVRETEDSEGVLTIGALTSLLFGYQTVEETGREEHVILSAHLAAELEKLRPLRSVWLNEIV